MLVRWPPIRAGPRPSPDSRVRAVDTTDALQTAPFGDPTRLARREAHGDGRVKLRLALVALALLAVVSVVIARSTAGDRVVDDIARSAAAPSKLSPAGPLAPAVAADAWLNSAPLSPADLGGKVVLYDFWTFACINCLHTLPHVEAWYRRYAGDGLVVVGIHTPEFSFEADPANVAAFVSDHELTFPVVLDPQHTVWRTFGNHYWPAFYLYDRAGHRRYEHIGEGGYTATEDAIRQLLGVDPSSSRVDAG
jgi:thiol-disulfide isomerase/thioredoxin